MLGSIGKAIGKAVDGIAGKAGSAIGGAIGSAVTGAIFGESGASGGGSGSSTYAPASMALGQYKMQPTAGSQARSAMQAKVAGQASIGADPVSFYGAVIQKALSGQ